MFFANLFFYILAFIFIWFGSGLIVSSASKFSRKLKLSPFAFSFVFLGILTSTPELSVGLQAVASHKSEIFVGNLLGGIVVLFLVIIPLLAFFGKGISLKHEMGNKTLMATFGVILAPSLFILDKKITIFEGVILVIAYVVLLFLIERKNGIFDKGNEQLLNIKAYSYKDILKILLGIGIVFVSSSIIVDKTIYFAGILNISAFYIGLFVIALGTDLPELTLAIRSVISGKKEIAMGDYIGAGAASTFLFGIFTLLGGGEVITASNFFITLIFIATALGLFYFFFLTKQFISRGNGIMLLGIYILFLVIELSR
ncbi:MAG: sodium:calcium antiporter [Candidatus Levybacteria bacterium]|nr:sodium:calcium antiporter [Candidatus Levybacteria bacterium]